MQVSTEVLQGSVNKMLLVDHCVRHPSNVHTNSCQQLAVVTAILPLVAQRHFSCMTYIQLRTTSSITGTAAGCLSKGIMVINTLG